MKKILYQTIEDRDEADKVELTGPFPCKKNPWLGSGFYFWDSDIHLGHWWGEYGYASNYMICESTCDYNERCWDLHNEYAHRVECKTLVDDIRKRISESDWNKLLFPKIINLIRQESAFNQKYDAIRACGIHSIAKDYEHNVRFNFRDNLPAYLDLMPAIQICLFSKSALNRKGYQIVFPEMYVQDQHF